MTVEIVATEDPDGYLALAAADAATAGGVVVEDEGLLAVPELPEVLVIDVGGERTYVVGGAGVYAATGPPDLARRVALHLLDFL